MTAIPHVAILIETSRYYGRGLLEGVTRYIREHGPWSIYFKPQGLGEPPPTWLKRWNGHGILARIDDRRLARAVLATRLPAIDLRGRLPNLGLPRVGVNNHLLARLAFEHLHERGLRHFAFCGLPEGTHRHMDERQADFVAQVEAAGHACAVFPSPRTATWEQEQRTLARWLTKLPRPVGILACNDDQGLQVLNACRRAGVLVPEEAAVIGIENDPIVCNLATPPLTSIDVNPQGVGYEAAALLDRLMQGRAVKDAPTSFFEQCRVVTRQSTDVCAVSDPEVAKAVRFIRAHACEGIRIEDVLAEVCLSRSMLERRFKQVLGRTAKAEILAVQMERARQLLIETNWPLETVARTCGIGTGKYFSDLFALKVGVRPAAYRRQHRVS